jgi:two-component system copper resistance phosphate regulon response regulator CusR
MRILIAEDEKKLLDILNRTLRAEGFSVDGVTTASDGLEHIKLYNYDLVILDLQLPDASGTSLLRQIREQHQKMPVLVLTARGDIESKIMNFEAGADDYLTKPFALAELTIRVQALLRRGPVLQDSVLKLANLELNRLTRHVKRDGKRIELSPKEYSLLEYLFLHVGRTLSRSMIVEQIWDQSFEGLTNIVDVYIRNLRRKVDEGYEPKLIHTVRGLGYSLDADHGS